MCICEYWCLARVLFLVVLDRNAGLQMTSERRRVVSSVVLEAEDLDFPPDPIFYVLDAGPRLGKLQLKVRTHIHELWSGLFCIVVVLLCCSVLLYVM